MAVQLIAAAARAAAKQAAKKAAAKRAASKGVTKSGMLSAKSRKPGDDATIARKRFYRASERYLKQANQTSGVTSERFKQLARQNFEDALATYDPTNKQRFSKPIQRLANEFGYDLESMRELPTDEGSRNRLIAQRQEKQQRIIKDVSEYALDSSLRDPDIRRQREAEALMRSPEIGKRIIGGLSDVWKAEVETYYDPVSMKNKLDTSKIYDVLFKHFGVNDLPSLLEKIEEQIGSDLYKAGDKDMIYDTVRLELNKAAIRNEVTR